MIARFASRSFVRLASVAALGFALGVTAQVRAADKYDVDPVHSFINFRAKHLNVSYAYGRFVGPKGTLVIDEADPSKSTLEVSVQADKITTDHEGRDKHLKGPDFFDVKQFPTISFKSTSVKKTDDTKWEVAGDLSLHGVTKPLTVTVTRIGTGPGMKGETRTGLESMFTVKRSDFGMTNMIPAVGDEITLVIAIEAIKQ